MFSVCIMPQSVGWLADSMIRRRTIDVADMAGKGIRFQGANDICGWGYCETYGPLVLIVWKFSRWQGICGFHPYQSDDSSLKQSSQLEVIQPIRCSLSCTKYNGNLLEIIHIGPSMTGNVCFTNETSLCLNYTDGRNSAYNITQWKPYGGGCKRALGGICFDAHTTFVHIYRRSFSAPCYLKHKPCYTPSTHS